MTYGVIETGEEYSQFAAGSSIGITIQRLYETESQNRGETADEYFSSTYYNYEHLLSFEKRILINCIRVVKYLPIMYHIQE